MAGFILSGGLVGQLGDFSYWFSFSFFFPFFAPPPFSWRNCVVFVRGGEPVGGGGDGGGGKDMWLIKLFFLV